MKVWAIVAFVLALAGCASTPSQPPEPIFHDALFDPPSQPIRASDVFAVSPEMKAFLASDIERLVRLEGTRQGLFHALHDKAGLSLDYDSAVTRNAAEAFAARKGNCLSLVIMTAAFAKELGVPVSYRAASLDETWSRAGNLLIASGHVNVTLTRRLLDAKTARDRIPLTIDFVPAEDLRGLRTREVDEATIVAMYANNRAAEAIADGRLDDAYAWAAESVRRDPGFSGAYNTLGVIYLRHGDLALAERAFERVLAGDARDTRALANLAETYARQGRSADAEATRRRLAALETYPPYHFFDLGMAAARRDDWRGAREMFAREVARADANHEFHFWLGVADWRLGEESAALRHLTLAIDNSVTRDQHDLYAAKLAWLQSRRQH